MSPLVRAKYPLLNPDQSLTGGLSNATQSNDPAFTNAQWFGYVTTDSAAGGVTAVANVVAVPITPGIVVTQVSLVSGNAAGTITNCNVQLFSGTSTPTALGTQSVNVTSTPFTQATPFTFTLGSAVTISQANAPYGYVYVSLGLTDSVAPSFASAGTPVALGVAPGTNAPVLAAKYTGGGSTQPATLVSPTLVAAAYLCWLT
jgi:hypothetical protein